MYDKGEAVPQDHKEAMRLYREAAEQGVAMAQYNLGLLYTKGRGVPQDHKEARKWLGKAADQELARAQNSLGVMYEFGKGVLQDNSLAHIWYNISSANGHEIAGQHRDRISQIMTREAIEEAQAMARKCMSSDYQNCGD